MKRYKLSGVELNAINVYIESDIDFEDFQGSFESFVAQANDVQYKSFGGDINYSDIEEME